MAPRAYRAPQCKSAGERGHHGDAVLGHRNLRLLEQRGLYTLSCATRTALFALTHVSRQDCDLGFCCLSLFLPCVGFYANVADGQLKEGLEPDSAPTACMWALGFLTLQYAPVILMAAPCGCNFIPHTYARQRLSQKMSRNSQHPVEPLAQSLLCTIFCTPCAMTQEHRALRNLQTGGGENSQGGPLIEKNSMYN